ncbi:MAG: hypothetical protein M1837_001817 [Sclerophora amabilis]|nr:MAG: hypothetical protein M1837_001817 [Sclerophora amabilis]
MSTYFITGANRGIGEGLVKAYLARPNTTVVGSVRDPSAAGSKALYDLPKGQDSRLVLVKIESTSETDPAAAVEVLESHGISQLDVVVANAGISQNFDEIAKLDIQDLKEHIAVNAIGPVVLFQAVWPLLQKSAQPKFVVITSAAASIGAMEHVPFTLGAYGSSKAMLNYLICRIHFENENLIAFPVHPGFVQTDMGNAGARQFGMAEASNTIKESIDGVVSKIDTATKGETSGKFLSFDGTPMMW